ncbi:DUF1697 domain-containing protein [Paenibacillus sp. M1]|uniref:DUF1697 domain-containing protein n=1 Tax=Paenibacillus haidiansis TaxID=1574488 RepID=A0ABU7VWH0_9BACL
MIYVALLRGINVGGKNKVDMRLLKQVFEQAGMTDVVTYINSGNIIFSSDMQSKAELAGMLEKAIEAGFGLNIKVVVRNIGDFQGMMQSLPDSWTNDDNMKSDALFLWEDVDDAAVLDGLTIKPEIDRVLYVPGAILWSVDRDKAAKSGLLKLIGTDLYRKMTIRNVNTTRKIYELMLEADKRS